MKYNQYTFSANVWLYPSMAGWHFITIPLDTAKEIEHSFKDKKRGWGSLPVSVTVGSTTWNTSIFPDKESDSYVLPLKAEVRKKEKITAGKSIKLLVEIKI